MTEQGKISAAAGGTPALRFIQTDDIHLVPRQLLAQVKDYDWTPEEVYAAWPLFNNPANLLYVLADKNHLVKGVVWLSVLLLQKTLFINLVSLDKAHQGRGFVQKQLHPFMRQLSKKLGFKEPYKGITRRPEAFGRLGFKRSRDVMVEGE
jgi:hypothetical protein